MKSWQIYLSLQEHTLLVQLLDFIDALEDDGYGRPEWPTRNVLLWRVDCEDMSFEGDLEVHATNHGVPTWDLSIAEAS